MNSLTSYRALLTGALLAFATTGCTLSTASDAEPEEAFSNESEALSTVWKCDVGQIGTDRCQAVIADARAQAAAVGRDKILERGIGWLEAGIIYNREGSYQGYRRDCSGFVSMAWEFTSNPNTALFPPFVQGKYAVELGSLDELVPGDAVNKTFRNPYGHVMLFAGWAAADHSQLYFIHHYATGKPVAIVQIARAALGDFTAIRSVNAPEPTGAVAPPTTPDMPPATPETPPSGCGVLAVNQSLAVDQAVSSCNGNFALVQQGDGNLVLYQSGGIALWSSVTSGTKGLVTVMQGDGNLVVYAPDWKAVWSSGTVGHPGATLAIQDDGNLVIWDGKPIWASNTSGK